MVSAETRIQVVVHGRVQGVGFRYFVHRIAIRLGLKGFVMNLPDGKVRVEAQGSTTVLDQLIRELQRGPLLARIDSVTVHSMATVEAESDFQIRSYLGR
jgi:acylphosphatase